jgi:hypothetical protein
MYGGVKYHKVRHALYCKKCFVTIESIKSLIYCSCSAIGIDDGRILGNLEDMEDRSMYVATVRGRRVWLPESALKLKARGAGPFFSDLPMGVTKEIRQHVPPTSCRSPSLGSDYTLNGYRSPTRHPPNKEETEMTYH